MQGRAGQPRGAKGGADIGIVTAPKAAPRAVHDHLHENIASGSADNGQHFIRSGSGYGQGSEGIREAECNGLNNRAHQAALGCGFTQPCESDPDAGARCGVRSPLR